MDATRLHLEEQVNIYGEQTLINLINHKGYEAPVKEAYERHVNKVGIRYILSY